MGALMAFKNDGLRGITLWTLRTARHWVYEVSPDSLEFFGGLLSLTLGIWLVLPFDTFRSSPVFTFVASVSPEETWGFGMLIAGGLKLASLFGFTKPVIRKATSIILAIVYGIWAFGLIYSVPTNTATVTYTMLSLAMVWAYVNLEGQDYAAS